MRTDSDYEDFYLVSKDAVIKQVEEGEYFICKVEEYLSAEAK